MFIYLLTYIHILYRLFSYSKKNYILHQHNVFRVNFSFFLRISALGQDRDCCYPNLFRDPIKLSELCKQRICIVNRYSVIKMYDRFNNETRIMKCTNDSLRTLYLCSYFVWTLVGSAVVRFVVGLVRADRQSASPNGSAVRFIPGY